MRNIAQLYSGSPDVGTGRATTLVIGPHSRGFQPVVRGPSGIRWELPRGSRATPEKLETRRILTKQNTGYNVQN